MKLRDTELERKIIAHLLQNKEALDGISTLSENNFRHRGCLLLFRLVSWYDQKYRALLSETAFEKIVADEAKHGLREGEQSKLRTLFVELQEEKLEDDFNFLADSLREVTETRDLVKVLDDVEESIEKVPIKEVVRNVLIKVQDIVGHAEGVRIDGGYVWENARERYKLYKKMEESEDHLEGIPTDMQSYDDSMGGLVEGTATILFGRTGIGKSRLLINIGYNVALQGYHVMYISREMTRPLLERCVDSRDALLEFENISRGLLTDKQKQIYKIALKEQMRRKDPFYVIYMSQGATPNNIFAEIDQYRMRHGRTPHVVLIDYLNLFEPVHEADTMSLRLGYIGEECHDICLFFGDLALVSVTQESRKGAFAREKGLEHIYGSHYIAPHFENAILLEQDEADEVNGVLRCVPKKSRFGSGKEFELFANLALNYIGDYVKLKVGDESEEE